jgi:multidrug efflux pump subunit AcrA (membrane-fusion protein)
MTNYLSSLNQTSLSRQPSQKSQTNLQAGQKVYLHGDTQYTGTLIRPLERTYPQKWTVELDAGSYEAVNLERISLIESQSSSAIKTNLEIPFGDEPQATTDQIEKEIIALKRENAYLKQENQIVKQQYREIERENKLLKKDLDQAKQILRRAKDISPLMRISLKRVLRLAHDACMDVKRTVGGWILKMGDKARKFRRLADIWDLLSQDEFYLSDIFPEDKLIAPELILPARLPKRPIPAEKTTFPLIRPEDVRVAEIEVEKAIIAVDKIKADLEDTKVKVPISGQILRINTRVGEQVNTEQGIVELGRTNEMYAIAEVYETDIGRVSIGQPAIVSSEYGGFTGKLKGTVEHLGLQVGEKQLVESAEDPTQDENSRIVEVKVRINPEDSKKVAGLTNMKVRVEINN